MACVSCQQKRKNIEKAYFKAISTYKSTVPCNLTEEDICAIKERLMCLKTKIKGKDFNKYLGFVNSLINLEDYCRYDLSMIEEIIDELGC